MQRTLLVIDDNVANLRVALDLLEAYSFKILTASNGIKGIERAQLAKPDLILLDIKMAGIDGLETCRRLKANADTAMIPIIFMTALNDPNDIVQGLAAGAVDYVAKPFAAPELVARVQTHLTLRDLQLRLEERVAERTATLAEEIERRKRSQQEQELLLDVVRQQSEQLRQLVEQSLEREQSHEQGVAQNLRQRIEHQLTQAQRAVTQAQQLVRKDLPPSTATAAINEQLSQALGALADMLEEAGAAPSLASAQHEARSNPLLKLSTREYEVLQLIAQGRTSSEIADILVLTRATVSTHRKRIMDKLEVTDLPALIKLALHYHVIE